MMGDRVLTLALQGLFGFHLMGGYVNGLVRRKSVDVMKFR